MKRVLTCVMVAVAASAVYAAPEPLDAASFQPANSRLVFSICDLELGSEGVWEVAGGPNEGAKQVYLVAPGLEPGALPQGRRMRAVVRERRVQRGRRHVSRLTWASTLYAKEHGGKGPASIEDLDQEKQKHMLAMLERSPWHGEPGIEVEGPYVFLIPSVPFSFDERTNRVVRAERSLLALELTPFVDDGKHWVSYTDGTSERVDIDQALLAKHDLQVRPVTTGDDAASPGPAVQRYTLVVARELTAKGALSIELANPLTSEGALVTWNVADAPADETRVTEALTRARRQQWLPYMLKSSSPVCATWAARDSGADAVRPGNARGRGATTSMFGVLGGRAAVRETLQMQVAGGAPDKGQARTIPIAEVTGVTVKSHPYEEMLGGKDGGSLPLADLVPPDRLFVYVARPAAILPFLDEGAEFLSTVGGSAVGNSLKYDLKERYLARMGMDERWLKLLLKSGAVREMAMVAPDLFFIDGTEISVVCRLAQPAVIEGLLKMIGVTGVSGAGVSARVVAPGRSVHWALRGDLLFVSTHRAELDSLLHLQGSGGEGSLGRSAEFRYMLTQLPATAGTRLYAYLSDPFIRRMVGPRVKIAQLRRVKARSDMERITALAMLARLDGIAPVSLDALVRGQLVPETLAAGDYQVGDDLVVRSQAYGSLSDMSTFSALPVDSVTQQEAEMYKRYVTNYSRFWRQFFDPIAMRLDDMPDQSLELTTFILPLVDNTIYNGLREVLHTVEDAQPLRTPVISPSPVLVLSLNLREKAWTGISKGLYEVFEAYAGVNPQLLDDLGPGFHLAIHDADPVIALGSGDIFGAFSAGRQMRNAQMVAVPVLLSVLTRPCTMVIETQDPVRTRKFLRQAASAAVFSQSRRRDGVGIGLHQVADRDEWVFVADVEGFLKLRYGLQVEGSHVMIRNIPWSSVDRISEVAVSELNGARIDAFPGACALQLPGLHAAATDRCRAAASDSMGHLYPLLASGVATVDTAEDVHYRLFGFRPVHPGSGRWAWDGHTLASSAYGTVRGKTSPPYRADDPTFGPLRAIDTLNVSMQFEDSGLRTKVRWKTK